MSIEKAELLIDGVSVPNEAIHFDTYSGEKEVLKKRKEWTLSVQKTRISLLVPYVKKPLLWELLLI